MSDGLTLDVTAVARLCAGTAEAISGVAGLRPRLVDRVVGASRLLRERLGSGVDGVSVEPSAGADPWRVELFLATRAGYSCSAVARTVQERVLAQLAAVGLAAVVTVTIVEITRED